MPDKINKSIYIRRALFTLVTVLSAALQHSGFIPELFGARAMLLIPAAVAIAMHEKSMAALCFGALSGVLWDFAVVTGDGFYTACLTVIGYFTSVGVIYIFRCKTYTAYILGAIACLLTELCAWLVFILMPGYEGAYSSLAGFYLPCAVYSSLFILPYYAVAKMIVALTADKTSL